MKKVIIWPETEPTEAKLIKQMKGYCLVNTHQHGTICVADKYIKR